MERDIFIISVYCLLVEIMQKIENSYQFRSKGFAPNSLMRKSSRLKSAASSSNCTKIPRFTIISSDTILTIFLICRSARPLSDKRLICGKPNYYARKCWLPKRAHHSMRCSQLTQCLCRFALTPEAANVINALPPSPITVIAPPKRWITTASNLDSECRVPV